jgi:hypothetical protein
MRHHPSRHCSEKSFSISACGILRPGSDEHPRHEPAIGRRLGDDSHSGIWRKQKSSRIHQEEIRVREARSLNGAKNVGDVPVCLRTFAMLASGEIERAKAIKQIRFINS